MAYEPFRDACFGWNLGYNNDSNNNNTCMECLLCTGYDVRALHPLTPLILTPTFGLGTLIITILCMLNLRYREVR